MSNKCLKISWIFFTFLLFFFFPTELSARIVINEFSSNSDPEWVELYNVSGSLIDLTGWTLADEVQSPKSLSGIIPVGGYFVFENPEGWLNNSGGDIITLKDVLNNIIDSVNYGKSDSIVGTPSSDKSAGRSPNISSTWLNNLVPTQGFANPSPTPTPTPTSTPTPTPTSTPTPTPTKTPTPTPTKTPIPKPSPKEEIALESQTSNNDQILGLREQLKTQEPEEGEESQKNNFPILPVILIIFGAGLMGFAGYTLFKKMKSEGYNNQSGQNL